MSSSALDSLSGAEALGRARPLLRGGARSDGSASSQILAFYACLTIVLWFSWSTEGSFHWFVLPIFLCGVLIGTDAVDWLRGRVDVIDPAGLIGLLGFHHFFMAPLLHIHWDRYLSYVKEPSDWQTWLGAMAFLNLLGLLLYRKARSRRSGEAKQTRTKWVVNRSRMIVILVYALVISGAAQVWVYMTFGGVSGYIDTYTEQGIAAFSKLGFIFTVSESFPILLLFAFVLIARGRRRRISWRAIGLFFLLMLPVATFFGGLRGSRLATVWVLVWVLGAIHVGVRRVPRKIVSGGIVAILLFLFGYGFYKWGGLNALNPARGSAIRAQVQSRGFDSHSLVLFDLARADVQAYILSRVSDPDLGYRYAFGRTYVAGLTVLIPHFIWESRPDTKVKEGTDALYGPGSYEGGRVIASNVYGLAGEAMLNFGLLAVPLAYGLLGLLVAWVRRVRNGLAEGDARLLLYPLLVTLCINVLILDSDNLVFFLVKNGTVPAIVIFLASRRMKRAPQTKGPEARGGTLEAAPARRGRLARV